MKKFNALFCMLAFLLLVLTGAAFAVVAGHVNPDADIDTSQEFTYNITSADVTTEPASLDVTVESNSVPVTVTDPDNLMLPDETTNKVIIWTDIKVTLGDYTPGTPITFHLENYPGTENSNLYAALRATHNITTASMDYQVGMYYGHEATVSNGVLSFTVDNPEAFFSSSDIVIATAKTVSSGGGGGGCNAGFAGLLLLAALPLLYLKKK